MQLQNWFCKNSILDLGNEYSTEDYSGEDEFQTTALEDILFLTDSPLQITTGNQKSTQPYVDFCTDHKVCSQKVYTPSRQYSIQLQIQLCTNSVYDLGNEYSTEDYSGEDEVQTTAVEDILLITDSPLHITTGNKMSRQLSANVCTEQYSYLQQKT